jgi:hypothetical protein
MGVMPQVELPRTLTVARWLGVAVLAAIGVPLVGVGLLGLGDPVGQAFLCVGLVLAGSALAGAVGLVAERRTPPQPRLDRWEGEPALVLPRASAPTAVASSALAAYAATAMLGALFAGVAGHVAWAVLLVLLAAWLLLTAAPGRDLAGGLWLTPTRVVSDHAGLRWQARWDDVTGVVPQQPMPVLVRADRVPQVERTGPRGRAWNPVRKDGAIAVDTRHLAGGERLASYVIGKAVTDPASRRVLGAPASLPPS